MPFPQHPVPVYVASAVVGAHLELIDARFAPREALVRTKKHLARYASGWPNARALRGELFAQSSVEAVRAVFWRAAETDSLSAETATHDRADAGTRALLAEVPRT